MHQAYADAGADVLLTNTFQANRSALSRFWGDGQHFISDYNEAAQEIIAPFCSDTRFALASIGPIINPPDRTEFPNLTDFNEVLSGIGTVTLGPNLQTHLTYPTAGILLETCSSPRVRFVMKLRSGANRCGASLTDVPA